MRIVCAWCDTLLQEGDGPTSHGICPSCRESFLTNRGSSLQVFLDGLPFPVLVVDNSFQPVFLNKSGLQSSQLTIDLVPDASIGAIVGCKNVRLPGGCGQTVHCSECELRRTLTETNETGRPFFRVPAVVKSAGQEVVFYISTVKTPNRVLVKLDKEPS